MPFISKIQRQSDYSAFPSHHPIVIDNGGSYFRIGNPNWAGESEPGVIFRNIIQRPRHKITGQSLTGVVGSPAYVAPEVLVGNYSEKVDIWNAGVLLHALLVGTLPFHGDSLEVVFEAIKKEKLDFSGDEWDSVSQPARDLLSRMLTRSVSERLTANEVLRLGDKLSMYHRLW